MTDTATRWRAARTRLGLTQREIAERIGCAKPRVSEIEQGKHEPSVWTTLRAAAALGIHPNELWGDPLPPVESGVNNDDAAIALGRLAIVLAGKRSKRHLQIATKIAAPFSAGDRARLRALLGLGGVGE